MDGELLRHDRDRWRDAAIHIASLGLKVCDVENCDYCGRVMGAMHDAVKQSIRKAVRGE